MPWSASLGDPKANGMFTVIDISGDAPKIVGTADIGHEALEGAMMSNDGKWVAGVGHGGSTRPKDAPQFKPNGMVVLYRLDGDKLTKVSEAPIGAWSQGASFSKDWQDPGGAEHDPEEPPGVPQRRRQAHRHRSEDRCRRRRRGHSVLDGSMRRRRSPARFARRGSGGRGGARCQTFRRSRIHIGGAVPARGLAPTLWPARSRSPSRRRSARPLCSTTRAAEAAASPTRSSPKAQPDGYTVLFQQHQPDAVAVHDARLSFDPASFVPIAFRRKQESEFVGSAEAQWKDLKEITEARAQAGRVQVRHRRRQHADASVDRALRLLNKIKLTHVPFRGTGRWSPTCWAVTSSSACRA
jgi:hypothetical protein